MEVRAQLSVCVARSIWECKARGSYFFGILGGKPLMEHGLLDVLERHPDCYFQIFTNGTLLTDRVARRFRRMGNVTPVISIEVLESESDARRGGEHLPEQFQRACQPRLSRTSRRTGDSLPLVLYLPSGGHESRP